MEIEKLDLKDHLIKMGMPILQEIIGVDELKAHPWFASIDWLQLYRKEIEPPFVPSTRQASDVSNVDPEFLAEAPEETPV